MKKKLIIIGSVLLSVAVIVFVICMILVKTEPEKKPEYWDNMLNVYIKSKYKERYLNLEFTNEDFSWSNIDFITYFMWNDKTGMWYYNENEWIFWEHNDPTDWEEGGEFYGLEWGGTITIYLIERGEDKIQELIDHINSLDLDFVYMIERISIVRAEFIN